MLDALTKLSGRLASGRGEEFVQLAGATIRAVSRGVIGISALQAFFAGLGLMVAGIPAASLITSAVLVLGIIQIGPSISDPADHLELDGDGTDNSLSVHSLHDPRQSDGQHFTAARHGPGTANAHSGHSDWGDWRYYFLRLQRTVSWTHHSSRDLGAACSLDQVHGFIAIHDILCMMA